MRGGATRLGEVLNTVAAYLICTYPSSIKFEKKTHITKREINRGIPNAKY
jgi:hypothetical protein